MAHDLTHVINRDVVVMTIAAFFASIAAIIDQFGFFFGCGCGCGGGGGGGGDSALLKITGTMQQVPQQDLRGAPHGLAAFYIVPPAVKQSLGNLFATHPPLEQRLAASRGSRASFRADVEAGVTPRQAVTRSLAPGAPVRAHRLHAAGASTGASTAGTQAEMW